MNKSKSILMLLLAFCLMMVSAASASDELPYAEGQCEDRFVLRC